jgi:hypothetical protein
MDGLQSGSSINLISHPSNNQAALVYSIKRASTAVLTCGVVGPAAAAAAAAAACL